jgi:hypothetical protein
LLLLIMAAQLLIPLLHGHFGTRINLACMCTRHLPELLILISICSLGTTLSVTTMSIKLNPSL